ncbi:MAG: hypothetical protein ACOCWG_01860 [bacterium]
MTILKKKTKKKNRKFIGCKCADNKFYTGFSRLIFIIVFVGFFFAEKSFSQGELDTQEKIFFRNESSFGFHLNSNGYGLNYRYGKWRNAFFKSIYEIDIITIKHPKEVKYPFAYLNARSFVYGKLNGFMDIRLSYGFQQEMFRKVDKGSISIKYFLTGGPSLGFVKPIYYAVFSDNTYYIQKFDPTGHQNIQGKDSFFKGIEETKINPGINSKIGFSFEYGSEDKKIHALEVGIMADVFLFKVPLMANQNHKRFFTSLFLTYRFGKVIDARNID